jgi:hypothetical protein
MLPMSPNWLGISELRLLRRSSSSLSRSSLPCELGGPRQWKKSDDRYEHADGLVGVYREQEENSSKTLSLDLRKVSCFSLDLWSTS